MVGIGANIEIQNYGVVLSADRIENGSEEVGVGAGVDDFVDRLSGCTVVHGLGFEAVIDVAGSLAGHWLAGLQVE